MLFEEKRRALLTVFFFTRVTKAMKKEEQPVCCLLCFFVSLIKVTKEGETSLFPSWTETPSIFALLPTCFRSFPLFLDRDAFDLRVILPVPALLPLFTCTALPTTENTDDDRR
jgi:hypothetical protein